MDKEHTKGPKNKNEQPQIHRNGRQNPMSKEGAPLARPEQTDELSYTDETDTSKKRKMLSKTPDQSDQQILTQAASGTTKNITGDESNSVSISQTTADDPYSGEVAQSRDTASVDKDGLKQISVDVESELVEIQGGYDSMKLGDTEKRNVPLMTGKGNNKGDSVLEPQDQSGKAAVDSGGTKTPMSDDGMEATTGALSSLKIDQEVEDGTASAEKPVTDTGNLKSLKCEAGNSHSSVAKPAEKTDSLSESKPPQGEGQNHQAQIKQTEAEKTTKKVPFGTTGPLVSHLALNTEVQKQYPDIRVILTSEYVELQGSAKDVDDAEKFLDSLQSSVKKTTKQFSKPFLILLSNKDFEKFIFSQLEKLNIRCHWKVDFETDRVNFFALDKEMISKAIQVIRSNFSKKSGIDTNLASQLVLKYHGKCLKWPVNEEGTNVSIVYTKDIAEDIDKHIAADVQKRTKLAEIQHKAEIEGNVQKPGNGLADELAQKSNGMSLTKLGTKQTGSADSEQSKVSPVGQNSCNYKPDESDQMTAELEKTDSINKHTISDEFPLSASFSVEHCLADYIMHQNKIGKIELRHVKIINNQGQIMIYGKQEEEVNEALKKTKEIAENSFVDFILKSDPVDINSDEWTSIENEAQKENVSIFRRSIEHRTLKDKAHFRIGETDICVGLGLIRRADMVVIPVNQSFFPITPASEIIFKKGGDRLAEEIQKVLSQYMSQNKNRHPPIGHIQISNVVGKLPCNFIAYLVVGGQFIEDFYLEKKLLSKLYHILELAHGKHQQSVAFPLELSRTFPVQKSSKIIAEAIKHSVENKIALKDICLCAENENNLIPAKAILGEEFEQLDDEDIVIVDKFDDTEDEQNHVKVEIVTGSLVDQRVDAIVCINNEWNLRNSAVAKEILKKGGEEIEQHLKSFRRPALGEVLAVTGGRLCGHVILGPLPKYSSEKSYALENLKLFLKNCFETAKKQKCHSLAFPVLGTGQLGYPVVLVAKEMFRAAHYYAIENGVDLVKFVLLEGDQNVELFTELSTRLQDMQNNLVEEDSAWRYIDVNISDCQTKIMVVESSDREAFASDMIVKTTQLPSGGKPYDVQTDIPNPHVLNNDYFWMCLMPSPLPKDFKDCLKDVLLRVEKKCGVHITLDFSEGLSGFHNYIEETIDVLKEESKALSIVQKITLVSDSKMFEDLVRKNSGAPREVANVTMMEKFTGAFASMAQWSKKAILTVREQRPKPFYGAQTSWLTVLCADDPEKLQHIRLKIERFYKTSFGSSVDENKLGAKVTRTTIRTRMSSKLGEIRPHTAELAAFERLKKSPYTDNRDTVVNTLELSFLIESSSFLQASSLKDGLEVKKDTGRKCRGRENRTALKTETRKDYDTEDEKEPLGSSDLSATAESADLEGEESRDEVFGAVKALLPFPYKSGEKMDSFTTLLQRSGGSVQNHDSKTLLEFDFSKRYDIQNMLMKLKNDGLFPETETLLEIEDVDDSLYDLLLLYIEEYKDNTTIKKENIKREYNKIRVEDEEDVFKVVESKVKALRSWNTETVALEKESYGKAREAVQKLKEDDQNVIVKLLDKQIQVSGASEYTRSAIHKVKVDLGIIKPTGRRKRQFTEEFSSLQLESSLKPAADVHFPAVNSSSSSVERQYQTNEGITVKVYKGDITNLPVDCIVNAANESLSHGAGVAAAISKAAGPDFQKDCDRWVEINGKLSVTRCGKTLAGLLHYKYIIHAVGPRFSQRSSVNDADDLKTTVINALKMAEDERMISVALPSISAGIFGGTPDLCADMYAQGVLDFSRSYQGQHFLKEIHFVDIHEKLIQTIQSKFDIAFTLMKRDFSSKDDKIRSSVGDSADSVGSQSQKTGDFSLRKYESVHRHGENSYSSLNEYGRRSSPKLGSSSFWEEEENKKDFNVTTGHDIKSTAGDMSELGGKHIVLGGRKQDGSHIVAQKPPPIPQRPKSAVDAPFPAADSVLDSFGGQYQTNEGITVKVYKGNITNLPVDCIVNAANESLHHVAGVSAAISKAAGPDFKKDCELWIRKHQFIPVTKCGKTTAGLLRYKCIIHAVGPLFSQRSSTEDADDLKTTVINALTMADDERMSSVALPSISAGTYGGRSDLCASMYVHGVLDFSRSNHGQHFLKEIHFVDIQEKMIQTIQSKFDTAFMLMKRDFSSVDDKKRSSIVSADSVGSQSQQTSDFSLSNFESIQKNGENSYNSGTNSTLKPGSSSLQEENDRSDPHDVKTSACVISEPGDQNIIDKQRNQAWSSSGSQKPPRPPSYAEVTSDSSTRRGSGSSKARMQYQPGVKSPQSQSFDASLDFKFSKKGGIEISLKQGDISLLSVDAIVCPESVGCKGETGIAKSIQAVLNDKSPWEEAKKKKPKQNSALRIYLKPDMSYKCVIFAFSPRWIHSMTWDHFEKDIRQCIWNIFDQLKETYIQSISLPLIGIGDETSPRERCCEILCDQILNFMTSKNITATNLKKINIISTDSKIVMTCKSQLTKGLGVFQPTEGHGSKRETAALQNTNFGAKGSHPVCTMTQEIIQYQLGGYDCDTIAITYDIPDGTQSGTDPNPGKMYSGLKAFAYLPNNEKGLRVLHLFKQALERNMTFRVNKDNRVQWSGKVEHKTSLASTGRYCYPDPDYLNRVIRKLYYLASPHESSV